MQDTLLVCWLPPKVDYSQYVHILSFLSPHDEAVLEGQLKTSVLSGRVLSQQIRDEAIALYSKLVVHPPSECLINNRSLRGYLKRDDLASDWWYHPVAGKDTEVSPIFSKIIQILTIRRAMMTYQLSQIVSTGGERDVMETLASSFPVRNINGRGAGFSTMKAISKGLVGRMVNTVKETWEWGQCRRVNQPPLNPRDVVFFSFWDSCLHIDGQSVIDRYYKKLPSAIDAMGGTFVYFLWLQSLNRKGMFQKRALRCLGAHKKLMFLQKYISLWDVLKCYGDIMPLVYFAQFHFNLRFRQLYVHEGTDYYPLFSYALINGFCGAAIPHYRLVELAVQRAVSRAQPKLTFNFLELFPFSKAVYTAIRSINPKTVNCAVQHASYNSEKLFCKLDPKREFEGYPDGVQSPKPDRIFTMGQLGYKLFKESGFSDQHLHCTGSPRYDDIYVEWDHAVHCSGSSRLTVLVVPSLATELEAEMVEAVYYAAREAPVERMILRDHPFGWMTQHARFNRLKDGFEQSTRSLTEDLACSDVVLFSYSTVAEEAILKGVPVIQWCGFGFNGSVFKDIGGVPIAFNIKSLAMALTKVQNHEITVDKKMKESVISLCFFRGDGMAASRIASLTLKGLYE